MQDLKEPIKIQQIQIVTHPHFYKLSPQSEIFPSRSPVFRVIQCNHGHQGQHGNNVHQGQRGQHGHQGQHGHHDHRPQSKAQQELSPREPRIQDGYMSRG